MPFVANDAAKTIQADGTDSDLQNAINYMVAKNQDGWVITVGVAGNTYNWAGATPSVPVNYGHSYTIQGAGSGASRTHINTTHSNGECISISTSDNKLARLSTFQFTATGTNAEFVGVRPPSSGIAHNSFRIDNILWTDTSAPVGSVMLRFSNANQGEGISYGLVDHCTFVWNGSANSGIYCFAGNNANQWATNMTLGTVDTITIEDCTFTGNGTTVEGRPAIDSAYNGVRWSARHNTFTNWVCVLHGADSAPTSTMQVEFHHNQLNIVGVDVVDYGLYNRGGVTLANGNVFSPGSSFPNQAFKFANDSAGGFEKVGQGAVSGVSTLIGSYFWGNTTSGTGGTQPEGLGGAAGITLGTDYFNSAPGAGKPLTSYTELVYPHPLQGGGSDTTAPSVPTGFAVLGTPTASSITLTWNKSTDPPNAQSSISYAINRKIAAGSFIPLVTTAPDANTYLDSGLQSSTLYTYQIEAIDGAGNHSGFSPTQPSATTLASSATTYYVSFSTGIDSNNGTATGTPWKNCPGMAAYTGSGTLNPGDTVNFNRADTWSMSTGTQGLWLTGGVTYVGNSFGTGSAKAILRSTGNTTAGTVRFRDHPTIATIFQGFEVDTNQQDQNGIDINHRFFTLMNGATKRVIDCDVHDVFSSQPSSFHYGIIASNNGGSAGLCANVEIINTRCFNISRDGICLYTGDPIDSTPDLLKNCTIQNCEAFNTGQDPAYSAGAGILVKGIVTNAFVEYNYCHNTKGAPFFISSNETAHFAGIGLSNIHVRYNIATTDNNNGGIRVYSQASGSDPKDLKIYGNIVYNETITGGLYIGPENANTLNLLIYNNTFYNAEVVFNFPGTASTFEFRNNICVSIGNGIPMVDLTSKILAHTNNVYRAPSGTLVTSGATSYTSANITSYEASALSSDPLFVNPANAPAGFFGTFGSNLQPALNGLSLQTGSPCFNSGFTLVSPYDNSINSAARFSGTWDRGAYEGASSGSLDTTPPTQPQNLSATTQSSTSIFLRWDTSTDTQTANVNLTYNLQRKTGAASFATVPGGASIAGVATGQVSFLDSGLSFGTNYVYQVQSIDAAGNHGNFSVTANATTSSVAAAPVFVQSATDSGLPLAAAFAGTQTIGNCNVVVVGWQDTVSTVATISDTHVNAYALAQASTGQGLSQNIYVAKNIGQHVPGNTVSVTFNGTPFLPDLRIAEYSGADQVSPLEAIAFSSGTTNAASCGPLALTGTNDLLFSAETATLSPVVPGSTFTQRAISAQGNIIEDLGLTSAGSFSSSFIFGSTAVPTMVQHVSSGTNSNAAYKAGRGNPGNNFKFFLPNPVRANNCVVLCISNPVSAGTISITDNVGTNTWGLVRTVNNGAQMTSVYVSDGTAAGTQGITVTFGTNSYDCHFDITEFYNVATASAVDVHNGATTSVTATISAGSITTTAANDLVYQVGFDTAHLDLNPPPSITDMTNSAGFTFLNANVMNGQFVQYGVVASTGLITPSVTITGTATDTFNAITIALKAASAGTAPPSTGIRISSIAHVNMVRAVPMKIPSIGNLMYFATAFGTGNQIVSSISDSVNGSWTVIPAVAGGSGNGNPQCYYRPAATASGTKTMTISGNTVSLATQLSFVVYDILNALPSPYDTSTSNASGPIAPGNFAWGTIVPSTPNGLIIAAMATYWNALTAETDAAVTFDTCTYSNIKDADLMDNVDGYAHFYNPTAASVTFNWTQTLVTNALNPGGNSTEQYTIAAFKTA